MKLQIPKTNLLHRAYGRVLRIFSPYLSDELYLKLLFRHQMGCQLNLDNPKTFNEKLQWLKLYNRNPLYTIMVDKVKAKRYVASKIGEQYIIPTLGVWENADDIDFSMWGNQCDFVGFAFVEEAVGNLDDAFAAHFLAVQIVADGDLSAAMFQVENLHYCK